MVWIARVRKTRPHVSSPPDECTHRDLMWVLQREVAGQQDAMSLLQIDEEQLSCLGMRRCLRLGMQLCKLRLCHNI
jgi:hypothetical protein